MLLKRSTFDSAWRQHVRFVKNTSVQLAISNGGWSANAKAAMHAYRPQYNFTRQFCWLLYVTITEISYVPTACTIIPGGDRTIRKKTKPTSLTTRWLYPKRTPAIAAALFSNFPEYVLCGYPQHVEAADSARQPVKRRRLWLDCMLSARPECPSSTPVLPPLAQDTIPNKDPSIIFNSHH